MMDGKDSIEKNDMQQNGQKTRILNNLLAFFFAQSGYY